MDRRKFIKVIGASLSALSSGIILEMACSEEIKTVPSKYRGFDIIIDRVYRRGMGYVSQIYVSDGKYHQGMWFKEEDKLELWKKYKPFLDQAIDRLNRKVA